MEMPECVILIDWKVELEKQRKENPNLEYFWYDGRLYKIEAKKH